ncbi:MAG: prolyl oligopeptidase family serine peptidase [Myxococcales bacterium]|nr:prolyl oligopeptidase family serine peptidase [Polyangiaceae bacterium]MDW8250984.1 prolyl oligopeptidase family serine peptidase [Myxococcales bacterium]
MTSCFWLGCWVVVAMVMGGCTTSSGKTSEVVSESGGDGGQGGAGGMGSDGGGEIGSGGEVGAAAGLGGARASGTGQHGAASRCQVTATSVFCEHNVSKLVVGAVVREVYWQTPVTAPPPGGYPVVLVYQGSLGGPSLTWGVLTPEVPFGGFHQGRLQARLLDEGFLVIAPAAAAEVAWQTNSGVPYELSTDKLVIDTLLKAIQAGQYGPADTKRLYATGISSGGYMTSRMAVSYPGVFRALAIQSASYATCLGAACVVPPLPKDHPPTLLLHGQLDTTVPLFTAQLYYEALKQGGFVSELVVDPKAGHEWLATAPEQVTGWFQSH